MDLVVEPAKPSEHTRQSHWQDLTQIALVLGTIEATLWTAGRTQKHLFLVAFLTLIACVLWERPRWRELGIGLRGLTDAAIAIPIAFVACSGLIVAAWAAGTLKILYGNEPVSWHAIFYAVWALEQEFILNSFFFRRIESLIGRGTRAVVATAILFSLVHIPNPVLVPATLIGGLFFVGMFNRYRNIYPLAIAHAMLGLSIAISIPDHWLHHMRVGLGFLHFHLRS